MIAPQGWKVGPEGVKKWRKATVKKRRNTAPGFKALDPYFLLPKYNTIIFIVSITTLYSNNI